VRSGTFVQYDATGRMIGTANYKYDKRDGPASTFLADGYKCSGAYSDDKRVGKWTFTNSDGSWYTTQYANGEEVLSKRSSVTQPQAVSVADAETAAHVLESPTAKETNAIDIVPKTLVQRERAFVNKTVAAWRKKVPAAEITTEHPVGSKSIDVLAKHDGVVAIGEFKASATLLPHGAGQAQFYRGRLCKTDSAAAEARRNGKLVTFVAVPSAPDKEDVELARDEANVSTWWPGEPLPFMKPGSSVRELPDYDEDSSS
jgi:hypothetical protein